MFGSQRKEGDDAPGQPGKRPASDTGEKSLIRCSPQLSLPKGGG